MPQYLPGQAIAPHQIFWKSEARWAWQFWRIWSWYEPHITFDQLTRKCPSTGLSHFSFTGYYIFVFTLFFVQQTSLPISQQRIYRHLINYVYKWIWSYTWFVYDRLQIFVRASILRKWSIEPFKLIQKFCQEEKERKEKRKKSGNNKTVCSEAELVSGLPILSCLFPKAFWILHSVAIST